MIEDRFVGFYVSSPFWAGTKPGANFEELTDKQFTELMSEEVFRYNHNDYKLIICKDGLFLFQTSKLNKELDRLAEENNSDFQFDLTLWNKYVNYLNCIYLLFESSVIKEIHTQFLEITEITHQEALVIRIEDGRKGVQPTNTFSLGATFANGRYRSEYNKLNPIKSDPRICFRREIPKKVFDRLDIDFERVFHKYEYIELLAQTNKSLSEYKVGNYSTSLVISWFIIESFLMNLWKNLIDGKNKTFSDGKKRVNSDRFKKLNRYPIGQVLNFLELCGSITYEEFIEIDDLREYRNDIIHSNKKYEYTNEHCWTAFKIIRDFISKDTGIDLELNLSQLLTNL